MQRYRFVQHNYEICLTYFVVVFDRSRGRRKDDAPGAAVEENFVGKCSGMRRAAEVHVSTTTTTTGSGNPSFSNIMMIDEKKMTQYQQQNGGGGGGGHQ